MSKIVKVLVPMDIDVELLDKQRSVLFWLSDQARCDRFGHERLDSLEALIGIIDAITDELPPCNTPCGHCGCTETPLHTNGVCGDCHEPEEVQP